MDIGRSEGVVSHTSILTSSRTHLRGALKLVPNEAVTSLKTKALTKFGRTWLGGYALALEAVPASLRVGVLRRLENARLTLSLFNRMSRLRVSVRTVTSDEQDRLPTNS